MHVDLHVLHYALWFASPLIIMNKSWPGILKVGLFGLYKMHFEGVFCSDIQYIMPSLICCFILKKELQQKKNIDCRFHANSCLDSFVMCTLIIVKMCSVRAACFFNLCNNQHHRILT